MGPGKSFLFAARAGDRRWLDWPTWPLADRVGARLEVLRAWRGLGAHIDSTAARAGAALAR
eukprot:14747322-Alexandrium_andersonii.AAC.1